ncbi:hypothetical protein GCM10009613_61250 [Pseudonocardia kongjuensis]|uniref:Uncharacterized protein n=1 Tax=Pseudonocardia kongjuensis TaxID=102227 RepID=A0ABN1YA34_9PSEU
MPTSKQQDLTDPDEQLDTGYVDLDLDAAAAPEVIEPFTVRLGGKTWTLEQPDGGLVMEIEEAATTRGKLSLIFDDQWTAVAGKLDGLHPDQLATLVRQWSRHFELDERSAQVHAAPNRAERRKLRRRK